MRNFEVDERNDYIDYFDYNTPPLDFDQKNEEGQLQIHQHASKSKPISLKNKYINKIKLAGQNHAFSKSQKSILPVMDKKSRNKLAAKESRERKKLYITMMEKSISQMEAQVSCTVSQIEKCRIQIQKVTNQQHIGDLSSKLSYTHKKLSSLVRCGQEGQNDNQINLAIDSVFYRFAATGRQRRFNINESYKQIFNLAIPSLHRYLLWSAQHSAHLFNFPHSAPIDLEDDRWFEQIRNTLGKQLLTQNNPMLQEKSAQFIKIRVDLSKLIEKLCLVKHQMQDQNINLDKLFTFVRDLLTPIQSAKFILFIQNYSYKEQLRYHQKIGMSEEQWKFLSRQAQP